MAYPLHVALLWHMHQPYYRDASTGDFALPWTRLHASKDYLHMAELLADFPAVHATVNLVPSLIEQLEAYAAGSATDRALRVSLREHLTASDKEFLFSFFFSINHDRLLNRYPPYRELLRQRQEAHGDWRRFSDQYWTDLIVWFNLAWFDPGAIQRDPQLRDLANKGANFTRADIQVVAEKSRCMAGPTLAAYGALAQRGQVELSTSPYYHAILPLLVDSASARDATPGLPLPARLFAYPEDALEQVRRALLAHERAFGRPAQGMWPSEGAVSQAVADLLARHTDLRWIASDEAVLARSLGAAIVRDDYGHVTNPRLLYQPYALGGGGRAPGVPPLSIMFRDRHLSDRIGFVYQHMDGRSAAEDMMHRLRRVRESLGSDEPFVVPIILDGENCWEYYENNGDDFLRHFYGLLSNADDLKTVTMTQYLTAYPPRAGIEHLAAGSWIGGDMLTWIGEPAQNEAWNHLARTRERLVARAARDRSTSLDVIGQAWQELYIAEGSDWFWWYSSRNNPNTDVFDSLFRGHLAEVYRNLGQAAPGWLGQAIIVQRLPQAGRPPQGFIAPALSARSDPGSAWAQAGVMEAETSSATMQRGETILRRCYYGYDAERFYLRCELSPVGPVSLIAVYFATARARANRNAALLPPGFGDGWSHELQIVLPARRAELRQADGHEGWTPTISPDLAINGAVVEASVRLADLQTALGDSLSFVLALARDGVVEERHPLAGDLGFRLLPFSST